MIFLLDEFFRRRKSLLHSRNSYVLHSIDSYSKVMQFKIHKRQFSEIITELIKQKKILIAYDVSVKNRRIGAYQVLVNKDKRVLMEKELFSKEQNTNVPKIAEAIIMLDIIKTINKKA